MIHKPGSVQEDVLPSDPAQLHSRYTPKKKQSDRVHQSSCWDTVGEKPLKLHVFTLIIAVAVGAVKLCVADTDVSATQSVAQGCLAHAAPETGQVVQQLKALYDHGGTMTCRNEGRGWSTLTAGAHNSTVLLCGTCAFYLEHKHISCYFHYLTLLNVTAFLHMLSDLLSFI